MKERCRQPGLALIEVLVALTLLASTGLALISWVQQSMETVYRAQQRQAISRLTLNAQAMIAAVNPAQRPEGRIESQGIRVQWASRPVRPLQPVNTFSPEGRLRDAPWQVGLFELEVQAEELLDLSEQRLATPATSTRFRALVLGYRSAMDRAEGRP